MTTEQNTVTTTTKPERPEYRGGFAPVAGLWVAAAEVSRLFNQRNGRNLPAFDKAMEELGQALKTITEARQQAQAFQDITDSVGRVGDQDGDVDVIGDWTYHNGEAAGDGGGYWVDAWVWVYDTETEEEDETDDEEPKTDGMGNRLDGGPDAVGAEVLAETAARAKGWTHGGDCGGIIYNTAQYGSWKEAVSWAPRDGAIYDTWVECCEGEDIHY